MINFDYSNHRQKRTRQSTSLQHALNREILGATRGSGDQSPCEYRSRTTPIRHRDEKLLRDNLWSLEPPRHAGPSAGAPVADLGVRDAQRTAGMSSERRTESALATPDRAAKTPATHVKSRARSEIALSDFAESFRSRAEISLILI